jgi:siroheme synthase
VRRGRHPFEVVPGVSAAVAASAGIPVTYRGVAASFAAFAHVLAWHAIQTGSSTPRAQGGKPHGQP